jgi:hypothetical protein
MRIIDAQVHEPPVSLDWNGIDPATARDLQVELQLGWMNALGVDAALLFPVDTAWSLHAATVAPGRFGIVLPFAPGGELKGYSRAEDGVRIDPLDPDIHRIVAEYAAHPAVVGCRIMDRRTLVEPLIDRTNVDLFARALEACAAEQMAVFMSCADDLRVPGTIAAQFPELTIVVDHLGLPQPPVYDRDEPPLRRLPELLDLARFENLLVKISGFPTLSQVGYPFADLWPALRQLVDTFSADRVMWGSDIARIFGKSGFCHRFPGADGDYPGKHVYAESLYYLHCSPLTDEEKQWLLARTVEERLGFRSMAT